MVIKFGTLQLCKALENLGFTPQKQNGTSHQKYFVPKDKNVPKSVRPFITVVHGRKQYFPPICAGYLRQIEIFGFSKDEIVQAFCK